MGMTHHVTWFYVRFEMGRQKSKGIRTSFYVFMEVLKRYMKNRKILERRFFFIMGMTYNSMKDLKCDVEKSKGITCKTTLLNWNGTLYDYSLWMIWNGTSKNRKVFKRRYLIGMAHYVTKLYERLDIKNRKVSVLVRLFFNAMTQSSVKWKGTSLTLVFSLLRYTCNLVDKPIFNHVEKKN